MIRAAKKFEIWRKYGGYEVLLREERKIILKIT